MIKEKRGHRKDPANWDRLCSIGEENTRERMGREWGERENVEGTVQDRDR